MKKDLDSKIKKILDKGSTIAEEDCRALMGLVRKELELSPDRNNYLILNLFCNWSLHTKIDQSNTGLRILAKVNDTINFLKSIPDNDRIIKEVSANLGFEVLRLEFRNFLSKEASISMITVDSAWEYIKKHLTEIIKDVPIKFPHNLKASAQKIYDSVVRNPLKEGMWAISLKLILVPAAAFGETTNLDYYCLEILTSNTTRIVIPIHI